MRLVLTGMCVGCQPQKEVLHFNTHVRVKDQRHLTLHNRTNQRWELKPVIEGEHWTGSDVITVEPLQSKQYEITYRPLIMTAESKKHMVSCKEMQVGVLGFSLCRIFCLFVCLSN